MKILAEEEEFQEQGIFRGRGALGLSTKRMEFGGGSEGGEVESGKISMPSFAMEFHEIIISAGFKLSETRHVIAIFLVGDRQSKINVSKSTQTGFPFAALRSYFFLQTLCISKFS